tara:strand:+ start:4862 stop:5713 length:852 start_codon:yes stop_codon:yes gene_type:complete
MNNKDKEIQRLQFLQELRGRKLMRKAIRKAITTVLERRNQESYEKLLRENDEQKLRAYVRTMLAESAATQDTDPAPHRSTGINVLSDLLKKIIPVLEDDFKILTTSGDQRQSFRAHVIHGVQNSLAPLRSTEDAAAGDSKEIPISEIDVSVGGDPGLPDEDSKMIDIDDSEPEVVSPEEEFGTGLEGSDQTGRNMAYSSFKKIERNILDSYELLSNDEDKELFYDYLITNLKLYFDKFEDELASNLDEPTTPEYEQAADEASADTVGGEEFDVTGGEEQDIEI